MVPVEVPPVSTPAGRWGRCLLCRDRGSDRIAGQRSLVGLRLVCQRLACRPCRGQGWGRLTGVVPCRGLQARCPAFRG